MTPQKIHSREAAMMKGALRSFACCTWQVESERSLIDNIRQCNVTKKGPPPTHVASKQLTRFRRAGYSRRCVFVGSLFSIINLMLDELRNQIWTAPNDIAERAPKIGGTPLRSVGQISRSLRILDNDAEYVTPLGESG